MYLTQSRLAAAGSQYRSIALDARIEGASPHQLVAILYEELARSLIVIKRGIVTRDFTRRGEGQARVLAILTSLETSLDFARGGDVARSLFRVYREVKRLLSRAIAENEVEPLDEARLLVGEIATAWTDIG